MSNEQQKKRDAVITYIRLKYPDATKEAAERTLDYWLNSTPHPLEPFEEPELRADESHVREMLLYTPEKILEKAEHLFDLNNNRGLHLDDDLRELFEERRKNILARCLDNEFYCGKNFARVRELIAGRTSPEDDVERAVLTNVPPMTERFDSFYDLRTRLQGAELLVRNTKFTEGKEQRLRLHLLSEENLEQRWLCRDYWKDDEFAYLRNGIDPYGVDTEKEKIIGIGEGTGMFRHCKGCLIQKIHDTLLLAADSALDYIRAGKATPAQWLAWAKDKGISIPAELEAAVTRYHGHIKSREELDHENFELQRKIKELEGSSLMVKNAKADVVDQNINSENKKTLLWIVSVALHKAWKGKFTKQDKADGFASYLTKYATDNGITAKSVKAIKDAIIEARDEYEIVEVIKEVVEESIQAFAPESSETESHN